MSRVVLQMMSNGIFPPYCEYIDVGCYDAMLVAVEYMNNANAKGIDTNVWPKMWELLSIRRLVNSGDTIRYYDCVVTMLNYCHNWRPEDIVHTVGAIIHAPAPRVILMDRESRTPHPYNQFWMDDALLAKLGISIVKLPYCRVSVDSDRDLLIWER
jgi:hypothetical protein